MFQHPGTGAGREGQESRPIWTHSDRQKKGQEGGAKIERPKDAAKGSEEFQETIRTNKNIIVWLAYQQGIIFQRFKGKEFGVSSSTISFKIAIIGLINYYPKMKNYIRCLYIF